MGVPFVRMRGAADAHTACLPFPVFVCPLPGPCAFFSLLHLAIVEVGYGRKGGGIDPV